MNTAKEKKLKSIKSDISEIKDFLLSNNKDEIFADDKNNKIENDCDDTLTLTDIVHNETRVQNKDELTKIKSELYILKSKLTKQEILLKEILLKIK